MLDPWEGFSSHGGVDNVGLDLTPTATITQISETVMRNNLRNQHLLEMRQIVGEVVINDSSINGGQMSTLLGNRRARRDLVDLLRKDCEGYPEDEDPLRVPEKATRLETSSRRLEYARPKTN